jgi:hypothetical protein
LLRFCHGFERIQHTDIWIGVEEFIEVVLSVDKLEFEELELMPGPFEFLFSLLKQSLEFLDHSQILLPGGSVIK